jgi:hypothetical protein
VLSNEFVLTLMKGRSEKEMNLSKEHEKLLIEIAEFYACEFEELKSIFENLCFQLVDIWDDLKEFAKRISEDIKSYSLFIEDKPSWDTPKKIIMKSQVHFNKPFLVRARSNC